MFSKNLFCFFALFLCVINYAQKQECGIVETKDSEFSLSKYNSFKAGFQNNFNQKSSIDVPVKVHIVRTSAGSGGLSTNVLYEAMQVLNENFDSIGLNFVLCESIDYIDNSALYDLYGPTEAQYVQFFNKIDALNIYFFNGLTSTTGQGVCGYAYYPWSPNKYGHYIAMKNSCAENGATLSHEIGHFFGLYHTHDFTNGDELVDGTNCSIAGDLCCDTPADPTLDFFNVSNSCVYTGGLLDPNGDSYSPNTSNIMSYSRSSCRNNFSAEQITRMLYYQSVERDYFYCANLLDVSISSLTLPEKVINIKSPFEITFDQSYLGSIFTMDQSMVKFNCYLSTDTILDGNDILISVDSANLGIDNHLISKTYIQNLPEEIDPGNYYLIVFVDSENEIVESNEDNNIQFVDVSIINFLSDGLTIYPNPVGEFLYYKSENQSLKKIEIIDNIGKLILVDTDGEGELDLSFLNQGSYLIRFTSMINKVTVFHFIKL